MPKPSDLRGKTAVVGVATYGSGEAPAPPERERAV